MQKLRIVYLCIILLAQSALLFPIGVVLYVVLYPFDKRWTWCKYYSKCWAYPLIYLKPGWSMEVEGLENIDPNKSYVIVANHNTFFDIPMTHLLPLNFRWVSKREVLMFPIFGWVLFIQRSLTIKRGSASSAKEMMSKGAKLLNNDVSVAIFPEGTRSRDGKVGEFKPGAFLMAKSAGVEILPVVLYGSRKAIIGNRGIVKLKVKVLSPISFEGKKVGEVTKDLNKQYIEQLDGASQQ